MNLTLQILNLLLYFTGEKILLLMEISQQLKFRTLTLQFLEDAHNTCTSLQKILKVGVVLGYLYK